MPKFIQSILVYLFALIIIIPVVQADEGAPIIVGLDADMSSGAALAGMSIQRGAEIAISEINAKGGVLGRPLSLSIKDHRGNPARGLDNIEAFSSMENVVAVLGGLHTPVALHELPMIHKKQMVYLSPWAAGTPVVKNGYQPNFVYRVSIRDEHAGAFLVKQALNKNYKRVALVLEQTGWGRSNERAMKEALKSQEMEPVGVSWFISVKGDMEDAINELDKVDPDVILLVANAAEGLEIVTAMASRPSADRVPIISHWGITGGGFFEKAKPILNKVDLSILQTYSFITPSYPRRAERVINAYLKRYSDADTVNDIFAPTGTAHAYDLIHLLALAIEKAATTNRSQVRDALENLGDYQGLVRNYTPAFTADKHDALDASDFNLSKYDENGVIAPLK
jgi:branched-chain amino acid transport system substrate-binding protein